MEEKKLISQENHFRKISFEFPGISDLVEQGKITTLLLQVVVELLEEIAKILEKKDKETATKE